MRMVPRTPRTPMQQQQWVLLVRLLVLFAVMVVVVFGVLIYRGVLPPRAHSNSSTPTTTTVASGTVVTSCCVVASSGIGISDGTYAFDTNRSDGSLKLQAAAALKRGDSATAQSLWDQAIALDSNDAEAFIYKEDQRVLAGPYITLVVATMLTGGASDISSGRDDLQGAYIAQKEYNDGFQLNGGMQVRLLIANSGGQAQDATKVAQQIVQAAKYDKTIVGVMGWPFSGQTLDAVNILANAHIPMVSSTASSDALTGQSPFFFRVCPSNQLQAVAGAHYVEQQLHAKQVVLFIDPRNSYSQSLATDFSNQFTADGGRIVDTEQYTVGDSAGLPVLLQHALTYNPDLIYFSGYADDMGVLLTDLRTSDPHLQIMGGDALYEVKAYPSSAHANYNRLRFTAFAFPDEWKILGYQNPPFFDTYARTFDPDYGHSNDPYGYSRPDSDVMLSYDATLALLQASKNVLADGNTSLTSDKLQQSLKALTGIQAVQGVSGQIAFGPDNNPLNKAVVVLSVNPHGLTQMAGSDVQGCFLKDQCKQ